MDIVLTRILECMGNRYGAGKDLANHLGISGNVITNWKNGSNRSYLKHLREIAEFYNVSESYLLGKTDIKNRPPELDDMADILSDPDLLARASEEYRDMLERYPYTNPLPADLKPGAY